MARKTTRLNYDLDEPRRRKLLELGKVIGASGYSEAARRLIDLGDYVRGQLVLGKPVDSEALRTLFFTHLGSED